MAQHDVLGLGRRMRLRNRSDFGKATSEGGRQYGVKKQIVCEFSGDDIFKGIARKLLPGHPNMGISTELTFCANIYTVHLAWRAHASTSTSKSAILLAYLSADERGKSLEHQWTDKSSTIKERVPSPSLH